MVTSMTSTPIPTTAKTSMGRSALAHRLSGEVVEVLMTTKTGLWVRTIWTMEEGEVEGREARHLPAEVAALVLEAIECERWG